MAVPVFLNTLTLLVSFPLIPFAILTTSISFFLLSLRALLVYVELFAALMVSIITPSSVFTPPLSAKPPTPQQNSSQPRSSDRKGSVSRTRRRLSIPNTSPTKGFGSITPPALRDFETVGGWRDIYPTTSSLTKTVSMHNPYSLYNYGYQYHHHHSNPNNPPLLTDTRPVTSPPSLVSSQDSNTSKEGALGVDGEEEDDDTRWLSLNKRLELPSASVASPPVKKHHRRSLTASTAAMALRKARESSRDKEGDGYFPTEK
ncbi:MAG: hypothetical protein M1834_006004 [Cirrosporium novae-zelandiae]|nr:MAG: hypothetical protein M1834_006004 [Cirrosporium novae-zelandiae]